MENRPNNFSTISPTIFQSVRVGGSKCWCELGLTPNFLPPAGREGFDSPWDSHSLVCESMGSLSCLSLHIDIMQINNSIQIYQTERGSVHPGTERGSVHPGTERGSVHPGTERGSVHPGTERGSVHPGTERGSVHPGTERGSISPGTGRGSVHPGGTPYSP